MFIIPRRGLAVVATLSTLLLTVLLTACATPSAREDSRAGRAVGRAACPIGLVQSCRSGALGNAETCSCQSQSQLESRFEWLAR
jgi:hypothetical protein